MLFGLLLTLGGCASQSCDRADDDGCRAERLLYQNDLMQAKILISVGDEDSYELARALPIAARGWIGAVRLEFYRALLIRQGPEPSEMLKLLEKAKRKAIRTRWRCSTRSTRALSDRKQADPIRAEGYRQAYGELDVARYPSFDKSLELVDQLVAPPPPSVPYRGTMPATLPGAVTLASRDGEERSGRRGLRNPRFLFAVGDRALPLRWRKGRRRWCRSVPPPSIRPGRAPGFGYVFAAEVLDLRGHGVSPLLLRQDGRPRRGGPMQCRPQWHALLVPIDETDRARTLGSWALHTQVPPAEERRCAPPAACFC